MLGGARAYLAPMRKDMSKVIVERPRLGRASAGLKPGRTRALVDDDGEPLRAREPKGPARKTKNFNENLNPLKRYLAANVGRPWNKVYSEISAQLKPTSTVQQHVRDHLDDFVAVKTRMKGGQVMTTPRFGGELSLERDRRLYFVHPRTGLLKKNSKRTSMAALKKLIRESEAAEQRARLRVIDAKTQLHLLNDGAWWEVKLAKSGDGTEPDVVLRAKLSDLPADKLYGRAGARALAKRQLSKAEMKKHKLR